MTTSKIEEKNFCYLQSGGPTAVINSSFQGLYSAYKKSRRKGKFYLSTYGIQGLINGDLVEVEESSLPELSARPGAYFGSLRLKLSEDPGDPTTHKILDTIRKYNIGYLFLNGGNDSMDTAYKLYKACQVFEVDCQIIGIPKTIDNDLYGTDHAPGYGTAAKYVANATLAIAYDDLSYEKGRINILETMGRESGFVAASASLASLRGLKPDYIFVPETPFSVPDFLAKVKGTYDKKGRCLAVVAEGIKDKDGILISASGAKDIFGHTQVGGVCKYLSALVEMDGYKTRGIELSVLNRASSFLPSTTDIKEAQAVGKEAFKLAINKHSGKMVTILRDKKSETYQVSYGEIDLNEVRNVPVSLPKKYINKAGDNILSNFLPYVSPLVKGNEITLADDGLLQ